jgi:hypothetical protein
MVVRRLDLMCLHFLRPDSARSNRHFVERSIGIHGNARPRRAGRQQYLSGLQSYVTCDTVRVARLCLDASAFQQPIERWDQLQ